MYRCILSSQNPSYQVFLYTDTQTQPIGYSSLHKLQSPLRPLGCCDTDHGLAAVAAAAAAVASTHDAADCSAAAAPAAPAADAGASDADAAALGPVAVALAKTGSADAGFATAAGGASAACPSDSRRQTHVVAAAGSR